MDSGEARLTVILAKLLLIVLLTISILLLLIQHISIFILEGHFETQATEFVDEHVE